MKPTHGERPQGMNGKEMDAALEEAGGNLTEVIRRELAAKGNTAAANAASGFDFWLAAIIPDADEAEAEARARGLIFGPDARAAAAYFVEARRRFDALTRADGEPMNFTDFEAAQTAHAEAAKLAARCRERICAALRGLARTKGEAAKLARGAIADFLNCLAADDTAAAVQTAFNHANEAARAYFMERGKWNGGPTRKHLPKPLKAAGRKILAEMGLKPNRAGQIEGLQSVKTRVEFGRRLMNAGLWTNAGDADLPERLLAAFSDADRRAAKRKRKPH